MQTQRRERPGHLWAGAAAVPAQAVCPEWQGQADVLKLNEPVGPGEAAAPRPHGPLHRASQKGSCTDIITLWSKEGHWASFFIR